LRACGPLGEEGSEGRDTLALPAKGVALCTPLMEQNPDGTIETEMPAEGNALCTPCMSGCQEFIYIDDQEALT